MAQKSNERLLNTQEIKSLELTWLFPSQIENTIKLLDWQDAKTLHKVGEWLEKRDQDIEGSQADWYLIDKSEINQLKAGKMPE